MKSELTLSRHRVRIWVQLILIRHEPQSPIRIECLLRQARQELFEQPATINARFFLAESAAVSNAPYNETSQTTKRDE